MKRWENTSCPVFNVFPTIWQNTHLFLPDCRFANPAIVRPYILLLKSYSKNTPHTNHCIARMLHRLAVHLKMDALFFQLSVFSVFNKILNDPAAAAYTVQTWRVKGDVRARKSCEHQTFSHYSIKTLPPCFWYDVGVRWGLFFTGTGLLCHVRAEAFLCAGGAEHQGVRWAAVLEERGGCPGDDRRLQQRRVGAFLSFTFSQRCFKNRNWSSLPFMPQRGKGASVDWRGGRGVAEAVRGAPSFWRFVLSAFFHLFAGHFCALIRSILCVFSLSVPDIVETLLPLLSNSNRTRRQLVTQLVHMGLVDNAKDLKKPKCAFFYG